MKVIKNAKIDDTELLYNIYYDEKIIKKIPSNKDKNTLKVAESFDLNGMILIPGAIDSHVHFNDPGFEEQEDFYTGTLSAAYGGVTTIIDMPCTSLPPVTNIENLNYKLERIKNKAVVDYAFWGGINGSEKIDEDLINRLKELKKNGVTAFKIYTISGMPTYKALTYKQIEKLFKLTEGENFIFGFHAEDSDIIENSIKNMSGDEKRTVSGYLKSRPVSAEVKAIEKITKLAMKYNAKIHIVHLSSKKGFEALKKYENSSCETCPHYLEFTNKDLHVLKGRLKTAPVVKEKEDKEFLRKAILNGDIDFVTTDHAGTDFQKNKLFDDFSIVYNGIPGVQTMLPYIFTSFYDKGILSLKRLIKITSENTAKLYGLYPQKGSLEEGSDADFTVMEKKSFKFNENTLKCKGKYSPFNGYEFKYRVNKTILRGDVIFEDGVERNIKKGKFLKPDTSKDV